MAGEDYQSWSVTAASNGNADSLINWEEGQARASVNNSSRSEMAAHAKNRNLLNGSIVTTGTANAQAFISGVGYTSIPTGLMIKLKIGAGLTNTGPATLNMDGIGATAIKTADGVDVLGSELVANGYADLLYNGTNWIFLYSREFVMDRLDGGGIIIGKQVFSTPGAFTYTPTAGMECCIVECIAAGGGGGGGYAITGWGQGGAGGGGGGYSRSILTAGNVGASQVVTIGAGGAGGSAVGPAAGGSGGNTTFGSLVVAFGGSGGIAAYNVTATTGGAGGAAGTGDMAVAGSNGECGGGSANVSYVMAQGGSGGPGPFGGRGTSTNSNGAVTGGNAPTAGYGGGGGGGVGWNGIAGAGGNGAGGLCIVTEFAGRGAPGRDGNPGVAGPIGPAGPAGAGTGDVLVSGTPAAGQIAEWVDTSHIRGIAPPDAGFTTGDAKITLKTVADTGWVMMNDGTIGNAASGASTRANNDCQNLFMLLWNNIADAWAPVVGGRGASAAADWTANKKITLPRQLGRSLTSAGAGTGLTSRALGAYAGEEVHTMTIAEMAAHNHPGSGTAFPYPVAGSAPTVPNGADFQAWAYVGATSAVTVASQGSGTAFNVMHPVSFWNVMIKL